MDLRLIHIVLLSVIAHYVTLSTAIFPPNDDTACESASPLNNEYRYFENTNETDHCDNGLLDGWYRFKYRDQEAEIPTNCIKNKACGTRLPLHIELDGASLPGVNETNVAYVCTSFNILGLWDCCVLRQKIGIRNCGSYYAYYLSATDRCPVSYCIQEYNVNAGSAYTLKSGDQVPEGATDESAALSPTVTTSSSTLAGGTEDLNDDLSTAVTGAPNLPTEPSVSTGIYAGTPTASIDLLNNEGISDEPTAGPTEPVGGDIDNDTVVTSTTQAPEIDGQVSCLDGSRVSGRYCDALPDCDDESDEAFARCGNPVICSEGQQQCRDSSECFKQCDGTPDCPDGSDEAGCNNKTSNSTANSVNTTHSAFQTSSVTVAVTSTSDSSSTAATSLAVNSLKPNSTTLITLVSESAVFTASTRLDSSDDGVVSTDSTSVVNDLGSSVSSGFTTTVPPESSASIRQDSTEAVVISSISASGSTTVESKESSGITVASGSSTAPSGGEYTATEYDSSDAPQTNITSSTRSNQTPPQLSSTTFQASLATEIVSMALTRASSSLSTSSVTAQTEEVSSDGMGMASTTTLDDKTTVTRRMPTGLQTTTEETTVLVRSLTPQPPPTSFPKSLPTSATIQPSSTSPVTSPARPTSPLSTQTRSQQSLTSSSTLTMTSSPTTATITTVQTSPKTTQLRKSTITIISSETTDILIDNVSTIKNGPEIGPKDSFEDNQGLYIFLIVFAAIAVGICLFGSIGTAYQRRMRTWAPRMAYEDAYADTEKSSLSYEKKKVRKGIESPIPDIDILREEQTEETSLSRASTMVLGAPSPVQDHTASRVSTFKSGYTGSPDFHQTNQSTANHDSPQDKLRGSLPQNGATNPAYKSERSDADGVVPVDEIDTSGPRALFPWIEQAEDTPL